MAKGKAKAKSRGLKGLLTGAPWQVTLVSFCLIAPTEFSVYIAGLRLPPHRLALIVLLPFALHRILVKRAVRIRVFDLLFLACNAWVLTAYYGHGEGTEGLVYGGSLVVESLGAYLVARAFIRDAEAFKATLKLLLLVVGIVGLLALPETLMGQYLFRSFLRAYLEGPPLPQSEARMGLNRAISVFDHPIHLGTFCASAFAMMWLSTRKQMSRYAMAAMLVVSTFTALSSAPLLCIAFQVGLLFLERQTRAIPSRVPLFLVVLFGLYVGVSLVATRSPAAIIATGFTIDSWTGYYRLKIWEHGMENVFAHPLLGIGLADWERPEWMVAPSVDSFWLITMMRSGIPSVCLMALGIFLIYRGVLRAIPRTRDKEVRALARGWLIAVTALLLVGVTVHFWNMLHAYFFFLIGMAGWLADPPRAKRKRAVATNVSVDVAEQAPANAAPEPRRPRPVYDPFPPAPPIVIPGRFPAPAFAV